MAKKKSKKTQFTLKPWCWYCEREFEDEKVLLQHQKAKHFKCRHCPRKLNTAGGLMVHCQQVHKTEPDKLENTLPGRDGYDVEIFGMEGVPAKDKDEWRSKKEAEFGVNLSQQQNPNKRPKIYHGVIGEDDLKMALEQHKMLMSGGKLGMMPGMPMGGLPGMPPPSMIPAGPPMFMPPPGMAPYPPFPGAPMPPFPGAAGPPGGMPFPPPPGFRPPFPPMGMPGMPGMPSPMDVPPFGPPGGMMGSPASAMAAPSAPGTTVNVLPAQDGVVWPDADASPAEKRAQQPQYRYSSPPPSSAPLPFPDQGHQPPAFAQTSGIPSASGAAPSASNLQDKYASTPIPEAPTGVPGPHSTLTSLDGSGVAPGETVEVDEDVTASLKRKAEDDAPVV